VAGVNEGTRRLKRENARGQAGAAARRAAQEKARDPERDRERREKIAASRGTHLPEMIKGDEAKMLPAPSLRWGQWLILRSL
jgi:hypothetical protein